MAIIWSGWVLRPRIVIVLQPFTLQLSGCDQCIVRPTHAHGGTLDLLITDVPALARGAVVATLINSDHSSVSAVISMAPAVPNLCVCRKVVMKHQVNWNTECGLISDLNSRNIWLADSPVMVSNEQDCVPADRTLCNTLVYPCAQEE